MPKTRIQISQELKDYAKQCVASATSYTQLRYMCRLYRTRCIEASLQHLEKNPMLVEELTERTLLLYHFCIEGVRASGLEKILEFSENDEKLMKDADARATDSNSNLNSKEKGRIHLV